MMGILLFLAVALVSFAGFALLAASQTQHRVPLSRLCPLLDKPPGFQRWAGGSLLAVSAALAILRDGAAFGSLVWVLTISLTAFLVTLCSAVGKSLPGDKGLRRARPSQRRP